MRKQSPKDNNPANPLFKVAALELTKDYAGSPANRVARLKVALSFKRSDDLRGQAEDVSGKVVNVSFGLSLRRATLELICEDDAGKSPNSFVTISKVAYVTPLAVAEEIHDNQSAGRESSRSSSASVGAKVLAKFTGLEPDASASASLSTDNKTRSNVERKSERKFQSLNVSATYGGNTVHWEFHPSTDAFKFTGREYLEGDVFRSNSTGKQIVACNVKRLDKGSIAEVVITGSLMTSMQDLLVDKISFTDKEGFDIPLNEIKSLDPKSNTIKDAIFQKDAKERLLKQIIRKHLVEQGMKTHGALLEISRASI